MKESSGKGTSKESHNAHPEWHVRRKHLIYAVVVSLIGLWFTIRDLGVLGGPTSNLLMWPLLVFVTGVYLWVRHLE